MSSSCKVDEIGSSAGAGRSLLSASTTFTDPRLTEILEEIELRAAVELEKLGQIR